MSDTGKQKRILLGQLSANGDCLYATAAAKQIKHDYPDCHLTWAINKHCRQTIENNPHVDEVWEIPYTGKKDERKIWNAFEKEAKKRLKEKIFDEIFFTQIFPNNIQNYDSTIRSSLLRGYPRPMTVPVQPVMRLKEEEVKRVAAFAEKHKLEEMKYVVLFESAARSRQSFINPSFALDVSKHLLSKLDNCAVILSSNEKIQTDNPRIIDGSELTLRDNAEVSKYCHLLVGCSSGISWICSSDWAKPLPTVQVLYRSTSVYASMHHDAEYFGLPTEKIIEVKDCGAEYLAGCIYESLTGDFSAVKKKYHEDVDVEINYYMKFVLSVMIKGFFRGHFFKGLKSFGRVKHRYGWKPFIRLFAKPIGIKIK